ncbi:MAG: NlpC/P60 family protein [Gemmatimonadota bacterium]
MSATGEQRPEAGDRLPDPSIGPPRATAHRSLAHLRREPRHSAELVTQMIMGEEALVLGVWEPWLEVRLSDGYVGWVHQGSVVRSEVPDLAAFLEHLKERGPAPGWWVVVERGAIARQDPDPGSAAAADLVRGAKLQVEDAGDRVIRVMLPDGTRGWLDRGAAIPAERLAERFPTDGKSIVEHAAEYLGLPYLWGGTSEKGFDCSGLVQRIYGLHGVALPRDAGQQVQTGAPIEPGARWEKVGDGDLAFFAEPPAEHATHVGILTEGGRMIHASTSRNGVGWDDLGTDGEGTPLGARLGRWLIGIRRVLPA